jgi:hypothetical protein
VIGGVLLSRSGQFLLELCDTREQAAVMVLVAVAMAVREVVADVVE